MYDVDAAYTILYFWEYDCAHCKRSIPALLEAEIKFKDRNVKVLTICMNTSSGATDDWREFVGNNHMDPFLNTIVWGQADHGQVKKKYDLNTTPQVFILDRNKVIRSKRIGTDQVEEVLENIFKYDQRK